MGKYLEMLVSEKIGCKVRSIELNVMQRCAAHLSSKTDLDEAVKIGEAAVRAAEDGASGVTMVFERTATPLIPSALDRLTLQTLRIWQRTCGKMV